MNRVERLIRTSFLELLKTESFYNIHVKDILEKESISRTSFYKYYQDKYDLLDKVQNDLIAEFDQYMAAVHEKKPDAAYINGLPATTDIFTAFFQFADTHFDTLDSLFGANGDGLFFDKVISHIVSMPHFLLHDDALYENLSEEQKEFMNSFVAYGYTGLLTSWMKQGKNRKSASEMGKIMAGVVRTFFSSLPDQAVKSRN